MIAVEGKDATFATSRPMIFFDLDGTLLDHETAERRAAAKLQQRHAELFPEPTHEFQERWHGLAEKHMDRFLRGEVSEQDHRRARIREVFHDHGIPDGEADDIFDFYLDWYVKSWRLFLDVRQCLINLRGSQLGIITNGGSAHQRLKLSRLRIRNFFSVVVSSEDVGLSKPDLAIFYFAAAAAGVTPAECVYVGDRLHTDAQPAHDAGFLGVWLDRKGARMDVDGAYLDTRVPIIYSLSELAKIIETHRE